MSRWQKKSKGKPNLERVTLVCVTGVDYQGALYALWHSMQGLDYSKVLLVSPERPSTLPAGVTHEFPYDSQLNSIDAYSHYMIYNLWRHIQTSHCLVVQADGYVLHPRLWTDSWLEYDYVGAPWRESGNAYIDPFGVSQRVGNGGFSLRSRKLLEVPNHTEIPWEVNVGNFYKHMDAGLYSEDGNICVHNRHIYESVGCVWAPLSSALKFSLEQKVREYKGGLTFGFHKRLPNLRDVIQDWFRRRQFKKIHSASKVA